VFPATIPSPRNNPHPQAQAIDDVQILKAFNDCFGSKSEEINYVTFEVQHRGAETMRTTRVQRAGITERESSATAIQRA
jgi:hypothetical protein